MRNIPVTIIAGLGLALPALSQAAVFCVGDAAALQVAFDVADNNGASDTVQVQQGTYTGSFVYNANAAESGDIAIEGGYGPACASRTVDPANTVLEGVGARILLVSGRNNSDLLIEGLTIRNGVAQLGGAGLDVDRFVLAELRSNVFADNATQSGFDGSGGANVDRTDSIAIVGNTFTRNRGGKGGGLSLSDFALARVEGNDVIDNDAEQGGGGIDADTLGRLVMVNNVVARNGAAEDGAGINVKLEEPGTLVATNNTVTANQAGQEGGGFDLKMIGDASSAEIYNNVVYGNGAGQLGRDFNIDNDDEQNGTPSPVALSNNDFDHSPLGFFITLPIVIDPSNLDDVDPAFVDAGNDDYRLQGSSMLIDAGTNSAPELPLVDRAGNARVSGPVVDIGAFEAQADTDGDGVPDTADNCTLVANPDQRDTNDDGFGNICDGDLNNDGVINFIDLGEMKSVFFEPGDLDSDLNGDNETNFIDLGLMKAAFFGPPGPSGGLAP